MTILLVELVGVALAVCIISVAAWFDSRERSISSTFLVLMCIVVALYLLVKWFGVGATPALAEIALVALYVGVLGAMAFSRVFIARGDLAIVAMTAILIPTVQGIPSIVISLGVAFGVSMTYYMAKTLVPNISELLRTGHVFSAFEDSIVRKTVAFFLVHKRANSERFCFAGETSVKGHRHLVLLPQSLETDDIEAKTEYVISAIPFMVPYLVGVCVMAVVFVLGIA